MNIASTLKVSIAITFALALGNAHAKSCQADQVALQTLGSGGPELDDGRFSSSYLVKYKGKARVLIDTGPGASIAFGQSGAKFEDLSAILLTHLHVDHSADLPAFIKGSYFTPRTSDLTILGPAENRLMPSTKDYVQTLFAKGGAYSYLQGYASTNIASAYTAITHNVPLKRDEIFSYQIAKDITAKATTVHHGPIAAVAWRVELANCSITFSGDMSNRFDTLAKLAENTDILVANNAIPEDAFRGVKNLHMPPSEIGKIAKQGKVKKVVLSHFMNRTLAVQQQTIDIIAKDYQGKIELAEDGKVFGIRD